MRGLVDQIRRVTTVGSSGATTEAWRIVGRDFQKVWEDTVVFFNRYSGENAVSGSTAQAFTQQMDTYGDATVPVITRAFLFSFLEKFGEFGRNLWKLPTPLAFPADTFLDAIRVNTTNFKNEANRIGTRPWMNALTGDFDGQTLWNLALQWSDPAFCELYTDLLLEEGRTYLDEDNQESIDRYDLSMTVVLRDRPFPTAEAAEAGGAGGFSAAPWWKLPLFTLRRQEMLSNDIGRGGTENVNTFLFHPSITQELTQNQVHLAAPLWDRVDIERRGVRKMDVQSRYALLGDDTDVVTMSERQRRRHRDWYMLNRYYLNGTLPIGHGRPDIRIGSRVVVLGEQDASRNETFYCEGVVNHWASAPGIRTTLRVTRGWRGDENSYRQALNTKAGEYDLGLPATANQTEGNTP